MKPLSRDELRELRADFAHLGLPDDQVDDMIRMIDNIIISVIEQNSGRHNVQLSLSARANYAFAKQVAPADISSQNGNKPVDHVENHANIGANSKHKLLSGPSHD